MDHLQSEQAILLYMMYISHKRKLYLHHCFSLKISPADLEAIHLTRSRRVARHMGRNPLCVLRDLHLQPLMLGEYPPLPKIVVKCMALKTPYICCTFGFTSSRDHCSHMKGALITAFVDTKLFVFTSRGCFPKRLSNFPLLVNGTPFLHSRSQDKLNHTDLADCVCSQFCGLLMLCIKRWCKGYIPQGVELFKCCLLSCSV